MSESTERKVWDHDWQIKGLTEGQLRAEADLENLKRDVKNVTDQATNDRINFAKLQSSLESAAKATEKAADQAISSKQYWLGVAAVCASIVGALIGLHG